MAETKQQQADAMAAQAQADATKLGAAPPAAVVDADAASAAQAAEVARQAHVARAMARSVPKDAEIALTYDRKRAQRVGALPARDIYAHEVPTYFADQETLDSVVATQVYHPTAHLPKLPKRAAVAATQRKLEEKARAEGTLTG